MFEIVEGADAGRQLSFSERLEIGRDPAVGVVLADKLVSRHHARVLLDAYGPYVEDLHSRNGTFVNGAQILRSTRIEPGDQVTVGTTVMQLRTAADMVSRPTAVRPVPPALAAAVRKPDYVPADIIRASPEEPELEALFDVRVKRMARMAPLGIFVLVVFAILIFLALRHP